MLSYIQICLKILVFLSSMTGCCNAIALRAYISQHGLHGEIEFSEKNASIMSIRTNLKPTLEFPDQIWSWSIHQFPVDYTDISDSRCSEKNLGKEIINLTDELGYIVIPGKDRVEFESNNVLTGLNGFWGKSLLLKTAEHDRVICSSIVSNDHTIEKIAVAKFRSPIAGSIYFRWIMLKELDQSDTYIETDLYHVQATTEKQGFTRHSWKVYVTDIFDSSRDNFEDNCDVLQLVFDPDNKGNGEGIGDLDTRLGKVKIAVDASKDRARTLLRDENLSIMPSDIDGSRRNLYIVIFDSKHPDSFLACGKIRSVQPKMAKSLINIDGIRGEVEYTQQSPFEPTWIRFQLAASDGDYESSLRYVASVQDYCIHQLPPKFDHKVGMAYSCNTTGDVYNPKNIDLKTVPPPGLGTQDQYPIGNLLGKYKYKTEYLNHKYLLPGISNELSGLYWDVYLPLNGVNSVIHRSLVIHRSEQKASICGILQQYDHDTEYETPVTIAQVIFRYPLVGKILLKQPQGKPWEDTTILMEYLIHADGSNVNNTHEHRWAIHDLPPGRDYYNWTARCVSAGALYDPHKVAIDMRHPEESCQFDLEGLCRLGDLSTRHSTLTIAGRKRNADVLSRRLYTDTVLPLDGRHSIVKRSLVIYDDHGPVARGERMACSPIERTYRRKAVVKDWFGNGAPVSVTGKLEIIQQSEYQLANAEVDLQRLLDVKGYRIHVAPVEAELEFPCENSSLYDTFNPYHITKNNHPLPTKGTPDQYELGDLSGKYGLINRKQKYEQIFNETQLSLFGPHSVLGRSLVLHSSKADGRWACSNIERGYSPSEARELRAIASFHNPAGFAYGYIRMTQLIYNDGSQSDTVIQVKLRHPGVRDRNVTYNHNWAIFVNPVSVDATVATQDTRCVAGGYRWNPYFTQLADPLNEDLYRQECGADNPLRCHVGDLSARLGPINIGVNRQIFMDSNFPLEGTVSAQGRSIVIMGPQFDSRRYACANIEPDKDIIKYANIRKPPRFVITQFIEDVRGVMGIPEWMLSVDSRKTRTLHQETCIQFLLHFKGPQADRLEQDFARLLSTGRLDQPSIFIAGYIDLKRKKTLSYRQCGVRDPNEKKKPTSIFSTFTSEARQTNIHNYLIVTIPFLLLFINNSL